MAQLKKLPDIIQRKRDIPDQYEKVFQGIPDLKILPVASYCDPVFWFTSFLSPRRDDLEVYLKEKGIQTRRFFYPLHKQPCYRKMEQYQSSFPVSSAAYEQGISLPSSYTLTNVELDYIMQSVQDFFKM